MSDSGSRSSAVPSGRMGRLYHLGRASGDFVLGLGWQGLVEALRAEEGHGRIALSPERARKLTERLGHMRGAVMKVGQLMSMDGADVLAPEAADILGALRESADPMPISQLDSVMRRELGKDWLKRFRHFEGTPMAAASIGQVHYAVAHDGRELALKIQFPGVRESIDSDLGNLGFLLRRIGGGSLGGIRIDPLLEEARLQLHREADYGAEAEALEQYAASLGDDPEIRLPGVHRDLSTERVLAMDYVEGTPIDRLAEEPPSSAARDHAATLLARLSLRELFEFQLVQTDPNFSNFLYDTERGRLILLDFGATHRVRSELVGTYRRMGRAARDQDQAALEETARALGYLEAEASAEQVRSLLELLEMSSEPLRYPGAFDFGSSDLFERVYDRGRAMFLSERFSSAPNPESLFLHRKFLGTLLLCRRLRARVDVRSLMLPHLEA